MKEEALHSWIVEETNRDLQLSYDQMLRIRDQIYNHPERLQWTLDVGNNWTLQRNGDALAVFKGEAKMSQAPNAPPWKILTGLGASSESEQGQDSVFDAVELCFGALPEHYSLQIKQVKECTGIKFTPLWRKGRSAIKIKEFLRGQKVPLHLRDEASVLCLSDDSSRHALAVHLESTEKDGAGKWMVNANFCPQDDLPVTTVVLGKATHKSHS